MVSAGRPTLGDLPLSSFTGLALEQLLQSKMTVLKPRSRNHLRAVVRRMFKVATRGGLWSAPTPWTTSRSPKFRRRWRASSLLAIYAVALAREASAGREQRDAGVGRERSSRDAT